MTNIQNTLSGATPKNHFLALLPHETHETHMKNHSHTKHKRRDKTQ